jgi:hypothetical protein
MPAPLNPEEIYFYKTEHRLIVEWTWPPELQTVLIEYAARPLPNTPENKKGLSAKGVREATPNVRVHRVYINDKIEGTSLNKHTLKAAAGEA